MANGSTAAQAKVLAGRWIGLKGGPAAKGLLQATSLGYWTSDLGTLKPTKRVAGKVVAKLPTVGLKAAGVTIYVAAKGKPFPLLVADSTDVRNVMRFTEWNKRVTFKAPKPFMVISA